LVASPTAGEVPGDACATAQPRPSLVTPSPKRGLTPKPPSCSLRPSLWRHLEPLRSKRRGGARHPTGPGRILVNSLMLLAAAFLASAGAAGDDPIQSERRLLEGVWIFSGGEEFGREVPPDRVKERRKSARWAFEGETVTITEAGKSARGSYRLTVTTSPKHLDVLLAGEEEPASFVYELKGDILRVCFEVAMGAPKRPAGCREGPDTVVLVLKREAR